MSKLFPCSAVAAAALFLAGCGISSRTTEYPEPRPLGRDLVVPPDFSQANDRGVASAPGPASTAASINTVTAASGEPVGRLTLQRALAQALTSSPDLTQFSYDIRSAEARTLQAGYRPNPEISVQAEDFGGSRDHPAFQTYQGTLTLSQVVELGGKRASRLRLARFDTSLAAWNYETQRLDVFVGTARAYVDVLAAQRRVALAEDTRRLEQQFYGAVSERARAGGISPLEERRAQVTLSNGGILLEQARRELAAARVRLAATWGSKEPRFDRAEGDLGSGIARPPPLPALLAFAAQNPDLARWETEIAQRNAKLTVERSRNVPDITVNAGARNYGPGAAFADSTTLNGGAGPRSGGGFAFVGGIGVPLPVFGLNQGNVLDAQAQLDKGRVQQQAAEVRVTASIRQNFERLSAAYETVAALQRSVLPAAQAAYDGISAGYQQGKFSLIEVLDARRAFFDARSRLVDAQATYQTALAEAERLVGQSLKDMPRPDSGTRSGDRP